MATLLALATSVGVAQSASGSEPTREPERQHNEAYRNPILPANVADPHVIKALDGYYYLYATTTTLGTSAKEHIFPIWRSTDLVDWRYVTDALATAPSWVSTNALWAPDVHYFNGQYYLYYTADHVKALPKYANPASTPAQAVSAIGVLTSPTPVGPWSDAGPSAGGSFRHGPIVPPSWGWCTDPANPGCYNWHFDSAVYQGSDGTRYLYEGSFFGGNRLYRLNPDGLSSDLSTGTQFGHNLQYEASSVISHDVDGKPMYYMLNSRSDCCAGPNSPYSVAANRGNQPFGTVNPDGGHADFSDQHGSPMEQSYGPLPHYQPGDAPWSNPIWWNLANEGGGFPVLQQNGNDTVGAGGQTVIPDLAGQDWMVYHGIDQQQPWQSNVGGSNGELRQLYLDPMQWTADGWPTVNSGKGPSRTNRAPVTSPQLGDNFNTARIGAPDYRGSSKAVWRPSGGQWRTADGGQLTGGYLEQTRATGKTHTVTKRSARTGPSGYVAQADLRSSGRTGKLGMATSVQQNGSAISATVDLAGRNLVLSLTNGGTAKAPLPAGLDLSQWNHLVITLDRTATGGPTVMAALQNEDGNPLAEAHLRVSAASAARSGRIVVTTDGTTANFDNVTLAGRTDDRAQAMDAPTPGRLDRAVSDDFGGTIGSQWSWLRPDASLHGFAGDGALSLTSNGNLDGYQRISSPGTTYSPTKNIVLQKPPAGDWMVETKMHFDPQNAQQQAGMIVYSDDDTNVLNGIAWNGNLTQVVSLRNSLNPVAPGSSCALTGPQPGSNTAISRYSDQRCPAAAEHTSQEAPANRTCCWVGNGQGPSADGSFRGGNADPSHITVWLRIYKKGETYTPWLSYDRASWQRENAWTLTASSPRFPIRVGLVAEDNGASGVPGAQAWFDYFHLYTAHHSSGH